MKVRFLMAGLFGLISATTFAQKGTLSDAQAEYIKYESLRNNKAMAKLAEGSLTNAKALIDKAAANEKTATLPATYAVKGGIYASLALAGTDEAATAPLFDTADEALKKAKTLDTKKESTQIIDDGFLKLAQYQLTKGIKEFDKKAFDQAYKSFDYYRTVLPEDTNAIYYTALAANNANMNQPAIDNYKKLLTTGFSAKARTYYDLSSIYLFNLKDTVNAIKILNEGAEKFPNDATISKRSIEISLQMGKQEEVLTKIENAIKNDPKNKVLYYYAGLTYSQVGEAANKKASKLKESPAKTTLLAAKATNFSKAADFYKKAVEIDPSYFEANMNLGYVLINPAIDIFNEAGNLPMNKAKEYNAAVKKSGEMFDIAKPYLMKAVELKPTSYDALYNLKVYYLGKKDDANAKAIQKQIDALK